MNAGCHATLEVWLQNIFCHSVSPLKGINEKMVHTMQATELQPFHQPQSDFGYALGGWLMHLRNKHDEPKHTISSGKSLAPKCRIKKNSNQTPAPSSSYVHPKQVRERFGISGSLFFSFFLSMGGFYTFFKKIDAVGRNQEPTQKRGE